MVCGAGFDPKNINDTSYDSFLFPRDIGILVGCTRIIGVRYFSMSCFGVYPLFISTCVYMCRRTVGKRRDIQNILRRHLRRI